MIAVRIKRTRRVEYVTNNIAHGMIERGEAVLHKRTDRSMRPKRAKNYKTR
jgi:hypothetical protein